ncbi:unnamed protein product [Ambrosiozyma monospora]|uniref:Unnamed protein product n=1 Tax=Ambrosiozyma monospora TaxID=43982 RepID=A0ACB5T276_AMBMO|nr:unnamed protein product [Ambrosiozyma monospora]
MLKLVDAGPPVPHVESRVPVLPVPAVQVVPTAEDDQGALDVENHQDAVNNRECGIHVAEVPAVEPVHVRAADPPPLVAPVAVVPVPVVAPAVAVEPHVGGDDQGAEENSGEDALDVGEWLKDQIRALVVEQREILERNIREMIREQLTLHR